MLSRRQLGLHSRSASRSGLSAGTATSTRTQHLLSSRRRMECRAAMQPSDRTQQPRLKVLSSISRAVEIQGLTAKFESLAGRSAMLGTSTALVIEAFTEEGIFKGGGSSELLFLGVGVTALAAILAALQSSNPLDLPLLEPVIASLTASRRSGAAVREAQVDSLVDDVIQSSFTSSLLSSLVIDAVIDDSQLI